MGYTLAIDAMGGDYGCRITVPATVCFLERYTEARALLMGLPEAINFELRAAPGWAAVESRLSIEPAAEVIAMDDTPSAALKHKKKSSMRVALEAVKEGRAQACVSAGNTGALMAISRFILKTLPGIDRPAIAKFLPNPHRSSVVLDLGANVDCHPFHLAQFAVMGSVLASAVHHLPQPRVGLLNVGAESVKGPAAIREAAQLIADSGLNFCGFVEGTDIYRGTTDVVVTDGFSGNILLKTSEGMAQLLGETLRQEFRKTVFSTIAALVAAPVLRRFKRRMDPRQYNGASLLGLRGVVVKSHGGADATAFLMALEQARTEITQQLLEKTSAKVAANVVPLQKEKVNAKPVGAPTGL